MFSQIQNTSSANTQENTTDSKTESTTKKTNKYKSVIQNTINPTYQETAETNYNTLDALLEKEKQQNKSDAWNKLNKTSKIQKLHQFAETYGHTHQLPVKEVKSLKLFFNESLDKNKLQKTKDIVYDKEKGTITSIPGLFFNSTNRAFTLKNMDAKRVSTIKSLTPHKINASVSTPAILHTTPPNNNDTLIPTISTTPATP